MEDKEQRHRKAQRALRARIRGIFRSVYATEEGRQCIDVILSGCSKKDARGIEVGFFILDHLRPDKPVKDTEEQNV